MDVGSLVFDTVDVGWVVIVSEEVVVYYSSGDEVVVSVEVVAYVLSAGGYSLGTSYTFLLTLT